MFTGIVEELATIRTVEHADGGARIVIEATTVLDDVEHGASIAVDGCCLTVVALHAPTADVPRWWAADAVAETLARTTLGDRVAGDRVNLERPVRPSDRLGGHIVQGHVDGVGTIAAHDALPDGSARITIALPADLARHVVEKGSIAVDGISLTVAALADGPGHDAASTVTIAVIPHTLAVTTLGTRRVGDRVNLETDIVAKYVERLTDRSGA